VGDFSRFISKVQFAEGDACWTWKGAPGGFGYGGFWLGTRTIGAHRASWLFSRGALPRLLVLHKCDNPACVRPDHLFIGTQGDNVRDCAAKGRIARGLRNGRHTKPERGPRGEKHGCALMTEYLVRELRQQPGTLDQLAARFGISRSTVHAIKTRRLWRHI
jgi:hypothetical protein